MKRKYQLLSVAAFAIWIVVSPYILWLHEHGLLMWAIRFAVLVAVIWALSKIAIWVMQITQMFRRMFGFPSNRSVQGDVSFYSTKAWRDTRSAFWSVADYATNGKVKCTYCGNPCDKDHREDAHADHVYSRKWYPHRALDLTNLAPACAACNLRKGARFWAGYTVDPRITKAAQEFIDAGMRRPRHWSKAA